MISGLITLDDAITGIPGIRLALLVVHRLGFQELAEKELVVLTLLLQMRFPFLGVAREVAEDEFPADSAEALALIGYPGEGERSYQFEIELLVPQRLDEIPDLLRGPLRQRDFPLA